MDNERDVPKEQSKATYNMPDDEDDRLPGKGDVEKKALFTHVAQVASRKRCFNHTKNLK